MYAQKEIIGGLSTTGDGYWSSSEANASYALLLYNYDGLNYNVPKNFQEWVRPVRAFGTPLTTEFINDGFEGGAIGGYWLNSTTNGSVYWTIANSGSHPAVLPHSGSAMSVFWSWTYTGSALIYRSSGFAIPSWSIVTLTFFMYHDMQYTNADKLQVQVSTDGGSNWINVGPAINRYDGTLGWSKYTIDLTAYHGQTVLLGFLGISAYGNDIYLDDVLVTGTN
jgi:hypothetical protein